MIDNNLLAYIGVLLVFLAGAAIVAAAGTLFLAAGFAVALALRLRKRRNPAAAVQADEGEVFTGEFRGQHINDSWQERNDQGTTTRAGRAPGRLPAPRSMPWERKSRQTRHDSGKAALTLN